MPSPGLVMNPDRAGTVSTRHAGRMLCREYRFKTCFFYITVLDQRFKALYSSRLALSERKLPKSISLSYSTAAILLSKFSGKTGKSGFNPLTDPHKYQLTNPFPITAIKKPAPMSRTSGRRVGLIFCDCNLETLPIATGNKAITPVRLCLLANNSFTDICFQNTKSLLMTL